MYAPNEIGKRIFAHFLIEHYKNIVHGEVIYPYVTSAMNYIICLFYYNYNLHDVLISSK